MWRRLSNHQSSNFTFTRYNTTDTVRIFADIAHFIPLIARRRAVMDFSRPLPPAQKLYAARFAGLRPQAASEAASWTQIDIKWYYEGSTSDLGDLGPSVGRFPIVILHYLQLTTNWTNIVTDLPSVCNLSLRVHLRA